MRDVKSPYDSKKDLLQRYINPSADSPTIYIKTSSLLTEDSCSLFKLPSTLPNFESVASKVPINMHQWDKLEEDQRHEFRQDFNDFGGRHVGSNTIIYSIPSQGWERSSKEELAHLQLPTINSSKVT